MKGELKAGGLALVIASEVPSDIGKCVTLVRFVPDGAIYTAPNGVKCRNMPGHGAVWVVTGDVEVECYGGEEFHGWSVFPPHKLMPIDGDEAQFWAELIHQNKPAELTA